MSRWFIGTSGSDGPRYYRQDLPLKHLGAKLAAHGIEITQGRQIDDAFNADICVFSRCIGADMLAMVCKLKQAGKVLVWDMDDDLTIPERLDPERTAGWAEREIAALQVCLDFADVITVSMPHLARALGREHKTVVLPNLIDLDDNPVVESKPDHLVIMYCGTSTHHRDIELFRGLYEKTCNDHSWVFVGILPGWMHHSSTFIPIPPVQSYHKVCRLVRPMVALAPLTTEAFNLSKSPIKIWETATLGACVVASNYGPYEGSAAAVVPAGQEFAWKHLVDAQYAREQCVREARANSWQESAAGPQKWLDAFLAIEGGFGG